MKQLQIHFYEGIHGLQFCQCPAQGDEQARKSICLTAVLEQQISKKMFPGQDILVWVRHDLI